VVNSMTASLTENKPRQISGRWHDLCIGKMWKQKFLASLSGNYHEICLEVMRKSRNNSNHDSRHRTFHLSIANHKRYGLSHRTWCSVVVQIIFC
jgi:hypothetical protein